MLINFFIIQDEKWIIFLKRGQGRELTRKKNIFSIKNLLWHSLDRTMGLNPTNRSSLYKFEISAWSELYKRGWRGMDRYVILPA